MAQMNECENIITEKVGKDIASIVMSFTSSVYVEYLKVRKNVINGNIYCQCVYEFKDRLKKMGFKWNGDIKKWYIPINMFTCDIYEKSQEVRFINYTTGGKLNYYYVYYLTKCEYTDHIKYLEEKKQLDEPKDTPVKKYTKVNNDYKKINHNNDFAF